MHILVLPGDNIGPEITATALAVLAHFNAIYTLGLEFDSREVGVASFQRCGSALPDSIVEQALDADGVVLGPCGMTEYALHEKGGINVPGTIRKRLDLYANIRPARSRVGLKKALPGLDCLIARKNTAKASRRIAQVAFEYASRRRRHVTAVGKRHVLPLSDGIFINQATAVAAGFPDVAWREKAIDAMAADFYTRPERHDGHARIRRSARRAARRKARRVSHKPLEDLRREERRGNRKKGSGTLTF